jgi:hypothetical protein
MSVFNWVLHGEDGTISVADAWPRRPGTRRHWHFFASYADGAIFTAGIHLLRARIQEVRGMAITTSAPWTTNHRVASVWIHSASLQNDCDYIDHLQHDFNVVDTQYASPWSLGRHLGASLGGHIHCDQAVDAALGDYGAPFLT